MNSKFKVGDKVRLIYKPNRVFEITQIEWSNGTTKYYLNGFRRYAESDLVSDLVPFKGFFSHPLTKIFK